MNSVCITNLIRLPYTISIPEGDFTCEAPSRRDIIIGFYGSKGFLLTIFIRDQRQCSDMGPSGNVHRYHLRLLAMLWTSIPGHGIGDQCETTEDVESVPAVPVQGKSRRHLQDIRRARTIQDRIARVLQNRACLPRSMEKSRGPDQSHGSRPR